MPLLKAVGTWLPLLAWQAAIFWFSGRPDLPHAPDALLDLLLKKGLHAAAYAVLAGLWLRALRAVRLPGAALLALVLTVAYAASDELHQSFVPGRSGRVADVLLDALGALGGLLALRFATRRRRGYPPGDLCV